MVRAGGKFRPVLAIVAGLALGAAAYAFNALGEFLAAEDPLVKADAVFVLAGTSMSRQLEGAELVLAGYAPRLVLSRQRRDGGEEALVTRGVTVTEDVERARHAFLAIGLAEDAIVIPPRVHGSTAAEAVTLREMSLQNGWKTVIVVSSAYHLRRAGFALRRELGDAVDVRMRRTRYDRFEPPRWWRRRGDLQTVVPEVLKLIAYLAGLGA